MQSQEGNEKPETNHHEEWSARHGRDVPGVRDEDVQDRRSVERDQREGA